MRACLLKRQAVNDCLSVYCLIGPEVCFFFFVESMDLWPQVFWDYVSFGGALGDDEGLAGKEDCTGLAQPVLSWDRDRGQPACTSGS